MLYILLGTDNVSKERVIADLRSKVLTKSGSENFDYEVLFGHKLNPDDLKKGLLALPAISAKRMIVLREVHKLSADNKRIVTVFAKEDHPQTVLLLESDQLEATSALVKTLKPFARFKELGKREKTNVFDMTNAMTRGESVQALKILNGLFENGDHPLQIMGGLVWYWGRQKNILGARNFQRGLKILQETDLNIKRSRLQPEYALEISVLKLCSLTA